MAERRPLVLDAGDHKVMPDGDTMPLALTVYTIGGGLPSASPAGKLIFVSDESGGAVPAFSDGTDWRRVTDRAVVS